MTNEELKDIILANPAACIGVAGACFWDAQAALGPIWPQVNSQVQSTFDAMQASGQIDEEMRLQMIESATEMVLPPVSILEEINQTYRAELMAEVNREKI